MSGSTSGSNRVGRVKCQATSPLAIDSQATHVSVKLSGKLPMASHLQLERKSSHYRLKQQDRLKPKSLGPEWQAMGPLPIRRRDGVLDFEIRTRRNPNTLVSKESPKKSKSD